MNDTHEVISAFLDDEPFDAHELASALSDPDGRAFLIDSVALRHVVQIDDVMPVRHDRPFRSSLRLAAAAAAVVVALMGGYLVGTRRATASLTEAPAPTRVVQSPTGWQEISGGVR
jgi:hypothetical protein